MAAEPTARVICHVSPWRLHVSWLIFGPMILLFVVLAPIDPASPSGEKGIMWVMAGFLALVAFLMGLLIRTARLEISAQGVRLVQVGYVLETSWQNVIAIRLSRGTEGLITGEPLTGKGVARLASIRGFGMSGVPMYDEERQRLLGEHRFIPIEPFASHLRKGRPLCADIIRFAPHLRDQSDHDSSSSALDP